MKLKKSIISLSIIGVLSVGGLVLSYADNDALSTDYSNVVEQSYTQLLESDGIEYVRVTLNTGSYLEMYRDTSNGRDQVDYYDSTGLLINRNISTDFGATSLSIGVDNSEEELTYRGLKTILPNDLIEENKIISSMSIIESNFTKDTKSGLDINWKQTSSNNNSNLISYTSKDGNLYIDSNTGNLVKREVIVNDEIEQTIEYNKIDRNSTAADTLFKLDSPLSSAKFTINFNQIEIIESNLENDPEYPHAINGLG